MDRRVSRTSRLASNVRSTWTRTFTDFFFMMFISLSVSQCWLRTGLELYVSIKEPQDQHQDQVTQEESWVNRRRSTKFRINLISSQLRDRRWTEV